MLTSLLPPRLRAAFPIFLGGALVALVGVNAPPAAAAPSDGLGFWLGVNLVAAVGMGLGLVALCAAAGPLSPRQPRSLPASLPRRFR